jgi:hypothetical protein
MDDLPNGALDARIDVLGICLTGVGENQLGQWITIDARRAAFREQGAGRLPLL